VYVFNIISFLKRRNVNNMSFKFNYREPKIVAEIGCNHMGRMYIGNDLNDFKVMNMCGFSACPNDSHNKIKDIATFVLSANGGKGVIRELTEDILGLNFLKILY